MEILSIKVKEYGEQEINKCFENAGRMIESAKNGGTVDKNMFKVIGDTLDKYSDKYVELKQWSSFFETLSLRKIPLSRAVKVLNFFATTYWKQKKAEFEESAGAV